jgi:hypothetical protein
MDVLDHVERSLAKSADSYRQADPFPHIVIDDFLPGDVLRQVIKEFPDPSSSIWVERINHDTQVKLASNKVDNAPQAIRDVMYLLNSGRTLRALEQLTGEGPLIADPHYSGGGLHQIENGGHLAVHSDFSKLPEYGIYRRLNLLVYLNEDWLPEYEGKLELWSRDAKVKVREVEPVANRAVIFTTDSTSYHGHPVPIVCPPGRSRRSLALYYYTVQAPKHLHNGIETRWRLDAGKGNSGLKRQTGRILRRVANRVGSWAGVLE